MIVNLTEKELKKINFCLEKELISAQGLAVLGPADARSQTRLKT